MAKTVVDALEVIYQRHAVLLIQDPTLAKLLIQSMLSGAVIHELGEAASQA